VSKSGFAVPAVGGGAFGEAGLYLELARFVLEGQPLRPTRQRPASDGRAPGNSETWFLHQCLRYLAGDGIVGVVSFAVTLTRTWHRRTAPRRTSDRLCQR
jgi:hypothetical protein